MKKILLFLVFEKNYTNAGTKTSLVLSIGGRSLFGMTSPGVTSVNGRAVIAKYHKVAKIRVRHSVLQNFLFFSPRIFLQK